MTLLKEEMAEMRKLMKELRENKPQAQAEQVKPKVVKQDKPLSVTKPEVSKEIPKVSLNDKYRRKKRWLNGI